MKKLIMGLILVILLVSILSACSTQSENIAQVGSMFTVQLEHAIEKTTLKEAGNTVGLAVPVPTYLPESYEVREVYLTPMASGPPGVILLISDREIERNLVTRTDTTGTLQYYELQCRMTISARWDSDGLILPPKISSDMGRGVDINEDSGLIIWGWDEESNDLWWTLNPDPDDEGLFVLEISVSKDFPEGELVRVAESVQQ